MTVHMLHNAINPAGWIEKKKAATEKGSQTVYRTTTGHYTSPIAPDRDASDIPRISELWALTTPLAVGHSFGGTQTREAGPR